MILWKRYIMVFLESQSGGISGESSLNKNSPLRSLFIYLYFIFHIDKNSFLSRIYGKYFPIIPAIDHIKPSPF